MELTYKNGVSIHSNLLVLKFGTMVHLVQLLKFEKSDFPIAGKCTSDYKIKICQNSSLVSKELWCHDTRTQTLRVTLLLGLSQP